MKLFNISQTETQLAIEKRRSPQVLRAAIVLGVVVFFSGGSWQSIHEARGASDLLLIVVVSVVLIIVARQAISPVLAVVRGEKWVFDIKADTIEKSGKPLGILSQIYSVRVWVKDNGENTTRHLAIQPTADQALIISDAQSEKEWQELVETAQQISDFTGIKLVRK